MERKTLSYWLRFIIMMLAFGGILIYAWGIPKLGLQIISLYPSVHDYFRPWLFFVTATALPCYASLGFAWSIAREIENDRSFSKKNAKNLKWISCLAAIDCGYFLIGNFVLMLLDMNHPAIIMISIFVTCIGIAISLGTSALSHIVLKKSRGEQVLDLPPEISFFPEEASAGEGEKIVSHRDIQKQ